MTFTFDPKAVAKREPASANPAKPANPAAAKPSRTAQISGISSFSISKPRVAEDDYTLADLDEMDRLLRELARMEGWSDEELTGKMDERQRMAPVNVIPVLNEIREAHKAALAIWPQKAKRSDIRLCKNGHVELAVIDGYKGESHRAQSSKTSAPKPETA